MSTQCKTPVGPALGTVGTPSAAAAGSISFDVSDVTNTRSIRVSNVQASVPAGMLANALAAKLQLPTNVPWSLRADRSAQYLDDAVGIGEQIQEGEKTTLSPRTHLG